MHKIYITRQKRNLGRPEAYRLIRRACSAALSAEGVDVPCQIEVTLTDDEGIREINRDYRGLDKPTDVLSFPQNEFTPGSFDPEAGEINPENECIFLGDMVLSIERAEAQGEEYAHGFERELSYLTVHSVLHMLGYDHLDEGEQKRLMRSREKEIMEQLRL